MPTETGILGAEAAWAARASDKGAFWWNRCRHLYLIGSPEGSAWRARPDFRLTRGSQLRAASIRAVAKPISGQNRLAGEPVLSSQSWRPGLGMAARAGEPPHPAVLRGAGRASIWGLLGHHPWLRPKVLPLHLQDACRGVVKLGPQGQAGVGLSSGCAISQDAV